MIGVLVMTDGRDNLLAQTLDEWAEVINQPLVAHRWIHDDVGESHRVVLRRFYPDWQVIGFTGRRGFAGAIGYAWRHIEGPRYVLHLEDDFVPTKQIDLAAMVEVMDSNPHLAQMALLRQPWSPEEKAAGGIVEMDPDAYTAAGGWLEHRKWFTTNPCLYRMSLTERGWPDGPDSERKFSTDLFTDPAVRCAYWGYGEPWVEHTGRERVGVGY